MAKLRRDPVDVALKSLTLDERRYLRSLAMGEPVKGRVPSLLEMRGLVYADDDGEQMLTALGCQVEVRLRRTD